MKRFLIINTVIAAFVLNVATSDSAAAARDRQRAILTPGKQVETNGEGAVLAVDTLDVRVTGRDKSSALQDSFEQAAIRQIAAVQQTYRTWSRQKPDLMGTLLLRLTVDETGSVTRADTLASRITDRAFSDIVIAEARKWRFPQGAESAELRVPFFFVPRGIDPNSVVKWERNVTLPEPPVAATAEPALAKSASERKSETVKTARKAHSQTGTQSSSEYLALSKGAASGTAVAAITNRPITLRESPLFSAKRISNAEGGAQVTVLERRGDWLRLRITDSGATGFVRKEFVSPSR